MTFRHAVPALLLLATSLMPASAEVASTETPAALRLVVLDQTQAVLPHATVTVYAPDGTPALRATADESGIVFLPEVVAGPVQIVASYPGFAPALETAKLRRGINAQSMTLYLAPVVETVTVKAAR